MDDAIKILGRLAMYEQPGSPQYTQDASGGTIRRVYHGPMSLLLQNRPRIGSSSDTAGYYLVSSTCSAMTPNALGELVLVYSNHADAHSISGATESVTEVEWAQIEKPLATHRRYRTLTSAELQLIEDVLSGKSEASEVSGATAQEYLLKRQKGVESYLVFAPVVRLTTKTSARPTTGSCGTISSPPLGISGYQFLKTADSARKSSSSALWDRTQEWTGADEWDSDLYSSQ